jgi:hypothetical protein
MPSRPLRVAMLVLGVMLGFASAAHAQPGPKPPCGSDVIVTSGAVSQVFDPFDPNPLNVGTVTLSFTRLAASSGGGKTQSIAFYMQQPVGSPLGNQVIWLETGENILFTEGGLQPTLNSPPSASQPAGVAVIQFAGAAQADTQVKTVQVILDANFDPVAQSTINFDMVFVCKATGNTFSDVTVPDTRDGVIRIAIRVLSGLQASYAGPALDFGDISEETSGGLTRNGVFHIRSSGAYTIELSSGNHFLMTYPGSGQTTPGPGTVGYSLSFLGQTLSNGDESFAITECRRAGTTSVQYIPISVTLEEGGVGKTPSPTYQDTLTVTFSPFDDPGTTQLQCHS